MVEKNTDPTALKASYLGWVAEMKTIFGETPQPKICTPRTPVAKSEFNLTKGTKVIAATR